MLRAENERQARRLKLLLIRHGDPDYEHDDLTETGKREAALLAERIAKLPVRDFYVSPLGRARATAAPTLQKLGRMAQVCDWLREFAPRVQRPDSERRSVSWDWLPQDWLQDPRFLLPERWKENERFVEAGVGEEYDRVVGAFDALLAEHGYVREGLSYRVERPNEDTLAFFCHYGVSCVLLSHLMNCSPMILWHGTVMTPSSVTLVHSEERRPGIAYFRAAEMGDVSHLYAAGAEPSFSARFCETYGNGDRID